MKKTILITENQRKKIILESISEKMDSEIKKNSDFVKNILESTFKTIKFNYKILFTFSAGISGVIVPISDYIMGLDPTLSEEAKNYILTAIIMIFFFENEKVLNQLYKKIEEQGLVELLRKAKTKTSELLNTFFDFLEGLNLTLYKFSDIVSYSFMIPLLPIFMKLGDLSDAEFTEITKRILMSGLITLSSTTLRKVVSKIIQKLRH